jgi:uncharacterized protein
MNPIRKIVTLTVTQNCNLSCSYCYEDYKANNQMSFDTAKNIINQYLNNSTTSYDECEIDLFGGEPFLNFPLIKEICEYVWLHHWQKPYVFSTTTNGTLVHGAIQDWLVKHKTRFYPGLSLDGTPEMHNLNRSDSFPKIDVPFFINTWPNAEVKMTLSQATLPHLAEGVIYLHSLGFVIHNNPAYGIDWSDPENLNILSRELQKLIDFYLNHPEIKPCSMMNMKIEYQGYIEKKFCGAGTDMAVFDVDGKKYPCHGFLPISIGKGKADASLAIDFSQVENLLDPKCKGCILYNICPTCYGSNFGKTNNAAIRDPQHCNLTKVMALACSYYEAQKFLNHRREMSDSYEDRAMINSIIKIQEQIATSC